MGVWENINTLENHDVTLCDIVPKNTAVIFVHFVLCLNPWQLDSSVIIYRFQLRFYASGGLFLKLD